MATGNRPLLPYSVLELGTGAGAFCGRILAELEANVTKLEPPEGDPMRSQRPLIDGVGVSYAWYNARKTIEAADLSDARGRERALELIATADVLIDGYRPGALDAFGLAPEGLLARFPRLIAVSVTDFGQTGPYRDWSGSALVDFAMAGSLLRCGLPTEPPCAPPYQLPYVVGGIAAAFATVAALWNRSRTGAGDWLDCSTLEALCAVADWSIPGCSATGTQVARAGAGPLFRMYRAADGWVKVINLSVKQWRAVQRWMSHPPEISGQEWDNPLYRAAHMDVQDAVFAPRFLTRTVADLFADGQANGVGIVPVYSPSEVMQDPHFRARSTFGPFTVPGGRRVSAPAAFVRMSSEDPGGAELPTIAPPLAPDSPPLTGIRVVEVGSGAVGPEISRMLGVLGADVVKIESRSQLDFMRLQGPDIESSPGWASSNRNKRSVEFDLKSEDGRASARRLMLAADVVVENNTAGVMERVDLHYESLSVENPGLVYVSSQAFGATGPNAGYGGFGPTNQAVSGTAFLWNHASTERPEGVQVIHPDHILGRMGAMAAVAALDVVRRGGRGQHIDLGQAEFAIACIGEAFIEASAGIEPLPRGNRHDLGSPYGVFPCAGDDQWIAITIQSDDEWSRLREVVRESAWEGAEFATVEARLAARDLIEAQLSSWTSQFPPIQLQRRLQRAGVAAGALYSVAQVLGDVHLAERGFFRTVTHPRLGALRMEGVGFAASALRLAPDARAPLLGEHTEEVLREWLGEPPATSRASVSAGAPEQA